MAMAMTEEAFKALNSAYHSIMAKSTLDMNADEKQAHAELLLKLCKDIQEKQMQGFSAVNDMIKNQAAKIQQATENLAPAANDSAYSSIVESFSKNVDLIDNVINLAY
jgi:hypothetical protein